ncbi:hypothetical protein OsJ_14754 [Oryza sativa Japonica Group]|uniref:Uncharacterized protein n=1 Tax=Oryza sativa subsp. japonica TaxID=39947 RepID=A3ATQ7_ORYSJ|nr:hypothetical protein OsJ_14754 [Oryza sativa Japonica Group]
MAATTSPPPGPRRRGRRRGCRPSRGGCTPTTTWCTPPPPAAHDAYFKRCHTTPGYVSFEDVIGSQEFEESSRRPPKAGISDPLLRATSRLYARPHPALHRRRSPGPLGTRRGGAVYRFVKRYVCPCLGFVAGIIGVKQVDQVEEEYPALTY